MVIGACTVEVDLPGVRSLKEKRGILKSLIAQIQKKFNASVGEVGLHDVWQSATIGIAVVSTTQNHAEEMLDHIGQWIEENRPDIYVVEQSIETIVI
jgi:hypothetical protein